MAMQNFFATSDNYRRQSPAQCSGKELKGEVRIKKEGQSIQVVRYDGIELNKDEISLNVVITDPETGEQIFNDDFIVRKR